MVINTLDEYIPGEITTGHLTIDPDGNKSPCAIRIIREITLEDFLARLSQTQWAEYVSKHIPDPMLRYYEVESLPD